jgi:hypothetical protein
MQKWHTSKVSSTSVSLRREIGREEPRRRGAGLPSLQQQHGRDQQEAHRQRGPEPTGWRLLPGRPLPLQPLPQRRSCPLAGGAAPLHELR